MKWQPSDTAPKDGTTIIADFGWHQPSLAIWNDIDHKWAAVSLNAQEMPDDKIDYWFENESFTMDDLEYWMPLPKLCLR
jgi:hypothetical protein